MEIKNLRKLIEEYHTIDHDPLVDNFKKQEIINQLKENSLFLTTAEDFLYSLREIFSQNLRLPLTCVHLTSRITNYTQNDSLNYLYFIKQTLQLKIKKEIFNHKLPEFVLISKNELTDLELSKNLYTMSVLPLLLENNMKNINLIHKTCWLIVENNYIKENKPEYRIF